MRTNPHALAHFLTLLREDKLRYCKGELWRYWEPRRNWLPEPRRAERETSEGYLMLRMRTKAGRLRVMAHRVVWAYFHGPIPEGLTINHKNGRKGDNRIENLEAVTQSVNNAHARALGLCCPVRGQQHPRCKLSDEDVRVLRRRVTDGESRAALAREYQISVVQVTRIVNHVRRGDVV